MIKDEYSRQRYEERKASNLCTRCGKPLDRQGTLCTACKDKHTAYSRDIYKKLQAVGVCPRCGKNLLYGDEKAVLSAEQNQPKLCRRYVLMTLKNTTKGRKHGEKHDMKKTRKMAYAHVAVKEKQTQDIVLAHFAENQ